MLSLIKKRFKDDQPDDSERQFSKSKVCSCLWPHFIFFSIFHPIFNKSIDNCLFKNECYIEPTKPGKNTERRKRMVYIKIKNKQF